MRLALSCIPGVESLVKREVRACGYVVGEVSDRLVLTEGDDIAIVRLNISSRFANRVYIVLGEGKCADFDRLYEIVHAITWDRYCVEGYPITIRAASSGSLLTSLPAVQRTAKRAVIDRLLGRSDRAWTEHPEQSPYDILILIRGDSVLVLLDTTGEPLHKRGYRTVAGEAPIKESLAAALVALSGWKYREPLYDPFCGSGTILIEAMMIARETAPGLHRPFAFQRFREYDPKVRDAEQAHAKTLEHRDRTYTIVGSDIDPYAVAMTEGTIRRAGMERDVTASVADVASYIGRDLSGIMVSNPPYGERLHPDDLDGLYHTIAEVFTTNPKLGGGIITSYDAFGDMIDSSWTRRKLYNGPDRCYWYCRKV